MNINSLLVYFRLSAHQTTISIEFSPDSSADSYDLCWKEYPQSWDMATKKNLRASGLDKIKTDADGLNPGMTYCLRLIAKDSAGNNGEPSAEMIVDTEAVSCTPQQKSCCIIQ